MMGELVFTKSGAETKAAARRRIDALRARLEARTAALDAFVAQHDKVRSYLVRSSYRNLGHGARPSVLYGDDDISSEEMEEIEQTCRRVFELQAELRRLEVLVAHLADDAAVKLTLDDLLGYGFEAP
jgi:3-methyladenine DNA glycosylase/8-oxoguanine DNA glycosylase